MNTLNHPDISHQKWLDDFRLKQSQIFLKRGWPTKKEECFKYTEIKNTISENKNPHFTDLPERNYFFSEIAAIRMIFINGYFVAHLSNVEKLPGGIAIYTLQKALEKKESIIQSYLTREFDEKRFPFAVLNASVMKDGMFLEISKNTKTSLPIHLVFIHTGEDHFTIHPRNIVVARPDSKVILIEEHVGENAKHYFTNTVTDIHAGENASIEYYKIQNESHTATHVANVFVTQHRDSTLKTFFLAKGAKLSREDLTIKQKAIGAISDSYGFYFLNQDEQHIDHHVHVDHLAPEGKSTMVYRGVLDKKSRAVFNGKVFVDKEAKHIHAHQANHHLLLSKEAEINTKPELEIYADEVKCTHGATVGQIDNDALFYLRSRGMEEKTAFQILTRAFSGEIFSKIQDPTLKHYMQKRMGIDHEL